MARQWTCVEAGCDETITAPGTDTIIELVQAPPEVVAAFRAARA